tara:strand:- start:48 stop:743 length:696 start_codon:yes stop_codon:yes gene_type:complete
MKTKPTYILFGCLVIISTSCHKSEKSNIPKSYYCSNLTELFSVKDSLPQIVFDYSRNPRALIEDNESIFNEQSCEHHIEFGLEMPNSTLIKVEHLFMCDTSIIWCGPPHIEINLTEDGSLRIGHNRIKKESLKSIILQNKIKEFSSDEIHFSWAPTAPPDSIQKAFTEIIKAQVSFAEKLSLIRLEKEICELDSEELEILKRYLSFDINLDIGNSLLLSPLDSIFYKNLNN